MSSASRTFSEADLVVLLKQKREKNDRPGIAGTLLFRDRNFIQVLERPEETVLTPFATILAAPRHSGIIRLVQRSIEARHFPDGRMGFQNQRGLSVDRLPGYDEFMNEPLTARRSA